MNNAQCLYNKNKKIIGSSNKKQHVSILIVVPFNN